MGFIKPEPFLFDFEEWKKQPFAKRVKMLCVDWATEGFGTPYGVIAFYALKIGFYCWMWLYFCTFSSDLGTTATWWEWWFHPQALGKAIVWTMLFEGIGLGSSSGPLTLRIMPPFGGIFYWLRPGTMKMPLKPGMPLFGGDTRTIYTVLLYVVHLGLLVRLCIAPEITPDLVWPTLITLLLLGVSDWVIFINQRPEIYGIGLFCFMFPEDTIAGLKTVWMAVWFWAAFSKLSHLFSSVVCTMVSNSFFLTSKWLRKNLYKNYPEDLRPSSFADTLAHTGTFLEFTFPFVMLFGEGGQMTYFALMIMMSFHLYITVSFPVAVPLEWNVIMMFGGWLLFTHLGVGVMPFAVGSPILLVALIFVLVCVPLFGNLYPQYVSFLLSMRYYAGNWAYSVWLFKGDKAEKMETNIKKSAASFRKQASLIYDDTTSRSMEARLTAFRHMHVQGRILQEVVPKAVGNVDDYDWQDGEILCGILLGWNFGDGHMHQERLLASVQKRCNYESGELVCIFAESQPIHQQQISWRIVDAKDGEMEKGSTPIKVLRERQPWGGLAASG